MPPFSIRFDESVLSRLKRRARFLGGATPSGLAQQLVDEGLRMSEFPGIVFKDGPSGRRAALAYGPDVWEVVGFLKEVDERGEGAVEAASEVLALPVARIRLAMQYYSEFPDEINARLADADDAAIRAEADFRAQQRLLA